MPDKMEGSIFKSDFEWFNKLIRNLSIYIYAIYERINLKYRKS